MCGLFSGMKLIYSDIYWLKHIKTKLCHRDNNLLLTLFHKTIHCQFPGQKFSWPILFLKTIYPHIGLAWKGSFSYVGNVYVLTLEKFFLSGSEKQPRFKQLTKQFENPIIEACLLGKTYPIIKALIWNTNLVNLLLPN